MGNYCYSRQKESDYKKVDDDSKKRQAKPRKGIYIAPLFQTSYIGMSCYRLRELTGPKGKHECSECGTVFDCKEKTPICHCPQQLSICTCGRCNISDEKVFLNFFCSSDCEDDWHSDFEEEEEEFYVS